MQDVLDLPTDSFTIGDLTIHGAKPAASYDYDVSLNGDSLTVTFTDPNWTGTGGNEGVNPSSGLGVGNNNFDAQDGPEELVLTFGGETVNNVSFGIHNVGDGGLPDTMFWVAKLNGVEVDNGSVEPEGSMLPAISVAGGYDTLELSMVDTGGFKLESISGTVTEVTGDLSLEFQVTATDYDLDSSVGSFTIAVTDPSLDSLLVSNGDEDNQSGA
jgi:hypothetical protein